MIDCFGPGVGHLNYLAVPGVGIFEFLLVPVTTNHLPEWEISVIFDFTFLPGGREFDSIFLENVKSPPYALPSPSPPPSPPRRLHIDRRMNFTFISCILVMHLASHTGTGAFTD